MVPLTGDLAAPPTQLDLRLIGILACPRLEEAVLHIPDARFDLSFFFGARGGAGSIANP